MATENFFSAVLFHVIVTSTKSANKRKIYFFSCSWKNRSNNRKIINVKNNVLKTNINGQCKLTINFEQVVNLRVVSFEEELVKKITIKRVIFLHPVFYFMTAGF